VIFVHYSLLFVGVEIKMKISGNDLCPCGSGKKYKNCCMSKEGKEEKDVEIEQQKNLQNVINTIIVQFEIHNFTYRRIKIS
jgi:hypothetical protein